MKVQVDKAVFEEMLGVLTQMPYAQVAGLLQKVGQNMQEVESEQEEE